MTEEVSLVVTLKQTTVSQYRFYFSRWRPLWSWGVMAFLFGGILVAPVFGQTETALADATPAAIPNYTDASLEFSEVTTVVDRTRGSLIIATTITNSSLDEQAYRLGVDFRTEDTQADDRLYTLPIPDSYQLKGGETRPIQVSVSLPTILSGRYTVMLGASDRYGHIVGMTPVTTLDLTPGERVTLSQCSVAGRTLGRSLDLEQARSQGTTFDCTVHWDGRQSRPVTFMVRLLSYRYGPAQVVLATAPTLSPGTSTIKLVLSEALPVGIFRLEILPFGSDQPLGIPVGTRLSVSGQGGRIVGITETDRVSRDGQVVVPVSVLTEIYGSDFLNLSLSLTSQGAACAAPIRLEPSAATREVSGEFELRGECRYPLITATLFAGETQLDQATRAFGERAPEPKGLGRGWLVAGGCIVLGVIALFLLRHFRRRPRSRFLPLFFLWCVLSLFGSQSAIVQATHGVATVFSPRFVMDCGGTSCTPLSDVTLRISAAATHYQPGDPIRVSVSIQSSSLEVQDEDFELNLYFKVNGNILPTDLPAYFGSPLSRDNFEMFSQTVDTGERAPANGGVFALNMGVTIKSKNNPARVLSVSPGAPTAYGAIQNLFVNGPAAPLPPTGFLAAPIGCVGDSSDRISLSWDSVALATGYILRDGATVLPTNGTDTTFIHTGLPAESKHTYTLQTVTASGTSTPVTTPEVTYPANCPPPVVLPNPPGSFTATALTACDSGQIDLSWDTVSGETYTLLDGSTVLINDQTVGTYQHAGLIAGTTHSYTATAKNSAGVSGPSGPVSATVAAACAVVAPPPPSRISTVWYQNPVMAVAPGSCLTIPPASNDVNDYPGGWTVQVVCSAVETSGDNAGNCIAWSGTACPPPTFSYNDTYNPVGAIASFGTSINKAVYSPGEVGNMIMFGALGSQSGSDINNVLISLLPPTDPFLGSFITRINNAIGCFFGFGGCAPRSVIGTNVVPQKDDYTQGSAGNMGYPEPTGTGPGGVGDATGYGFERWMSNLVNADSGFTASWMAYESTRQEYQRVSYYAQHNFKVPLTPGFYNVDLYGRHDQEGWDAIPAPLQFEVTGTPPIVAPTCTWQDIGTTGAAKLFPVQSTTDLTKVCDTSTATWTLRTECPVGVVAGGSATGFADGFTCHDATTKTSGAAYGPGVCMAKAYRSTCTSGGAAASAPWVFMTGSDRSIALAPQTLWQRVYVWVRDYFRPTAEAAGGPVSVTASALGTGTGYLRWTSSGVTSCDLTIPGDTVPFRQVDPDSATNTPNGYLIPVPLPVGITTVQIDCHDLANTVTVTDTVTFNVSSPSDLKVCPSAGTVIPGNGGVTHLRAYYVSNGTVDCTTAVPGGPDDVTASATWKTSAPGVATVAGGMVTSVTNVVGATTNITAEYTPPAATLLTSAPITVTIACVPIDPCQNPATLATLATMCPSDSIQLSNGCGANVTCRGTRTCDFNWKEVGQ